MYFLLSNYLNNKETKWFVQDSRDFLSQNEEFLNEYGNVINMTTKDKFPPDSIENNGIEEYYMDFDCETEKATFKIRVYHFYIDEWNFRYVVYGDTVKWKT